MVPGGWRRSGKKVPVLHPAKVYQLYFLEEICRLLPIWKTSQPSIYLALVLGPYPHGGTYLLIMTKNFFSVSE